MGKSSGGVRGGSRLSALAKEAVDYYVDGNGYDLNYALRNNEALSREDALLQRGLDEATDRALGKDYTLYRGVSAASIFGEDVQYGLLKSAIVNGDREAYVVEALEKAKKIAYQPKRDKGYMSSSTSLEQAESFGGNQNVIMRMTVKKGTKGIDLAKNRSIYKTNTYEKEVILSRGLSYKITKIGSHKGKIIVDAIIG